MSVHSSQKNQSGFTLIEMMMVMVISVIAAISMFTFFNSSLKTYLPLHEEGLAFSDLETGADRMGNVLRGLTNITQADSNSITCYAYFYPNDAYVSLVNYYQSGGALLVDVTPMTANPPLGAPITASKRTYTIITKLYEPAGVSAFVYMDASNAVMPIPITNLHDIKAIRVNLGIPVTVPSATGNDTISLQVSLRNRKTNL